MHWSIARIFILAVEQGVYLEIFPRIPSSPCLCDRLASAPWLSLLTVVLCHFVQLQYWSLFSFHLPRCSQCFEQMRYATKRQSIHIAWRPKWASDVERGRSAAREGTGHPTSDTVAHDGIFHTGYYPKLMSSTGLHFCYGSNESIMKTRPKKSRTSGPSHNGDRSSWWACVQQLLF